MKNILIVSFLTAIIFVSSLSVIYIKHNSRKIFSELNELQASRDKMNVEWGQLQLEQSTWATHGRIERIARKKIGMGIPDYQDIIFITAKENINDDTR
ncbi:MAG: cell division protein FtsL [Gammaproteobacteria bacterium]